VRFGAGDGDRALARDLVGFLAGHLDERLPLATLSVSSASCTVTVRARLIVTV
jgi:hypothetical protein